MSTALGPHGPQVHHMIAKASWLPFRPPIWVGPAFISECGYTFWRSQRECGLPTVLEVSACCLHLTPVGGLSRVQLPSGLIAKSFAPLPLLLLCKTGRQVRGETFVPSLWAFHNTGHRGQALFHKGERAMIAPTCSRTSFWLTAYASTVAEVCAQQRGAQES